MKLSALIQLLQENAIAGNDPEVLIDLDMGEFGNHELDPTSTFVFEGTIYITTEVVNNETLTKNSI